MLAALFPAIAGMAAAVQAVPLPAVPSSRSSEPPPAWADELAGLQPMADQELAEQRGGFRWEGVEIGFGAEIRTYLNGELALQTNIGWTAAGVSTNQWVSAALAPADAAQLQAGILTSGGIVMKVGDQSVFLANQGQTAILHRTDGALQNVLVNRASNITASQEVDAMLDLGNFSQLQDRLTDLRLGQAIGDAVGQATIGAVGN